MKKIVIALLAVVMVLCSIGLVACDNANVLDDYIFEYDGTVVTKDFVLPKTIGNKNAKWSSNNNAVALTKGEDSWTAKINFPEADQVTVTLTLTVGGKSKDFTVIVKAIDVYNIADNYNFLQNKATVTADFELDTETTFEGKTATIVWTVDEDCKNYIAIGTNDAGKTICKVNPQSEQTAVTINATFTYKGQSTTYPYDMTVYKTMEGYELVDYWYSNTGVSITMSGYVVEIGTAYSDSYNNVTLYMVNDDFTAGYYLYRVGCDAENGKLLKPGVHVTCTGTTNTDYKGLIETNAGGTLVVDTDIPEINVRDHVYAVDQDVIGNLPATVYNESRLVSLTNWTVKKIDATDDSLSTGNFTLMTITKGGVDVNVRISKYLEGAYASKVGDTVFDSIVALRDTYGTKGEDGKYTVNEGATISVTGIFSKYDKNWQIMPLVATDITAGTADTIETKDFVGTKVAAAIKEVNTTLKTAGLDGSKRITSTATATIPATSGDVAISVRQINSTSVAVSENVITVTPGAREQSTVEITYTLGEFKTVQFVYITSLIPTAETMLDDLAEEMPESIKAVFDLPTVPDGATIEWSVKRGTNSAGETVIEIIDGQIVPTLGQEKVNGITVTAKLTYNGETKSQNFRFAIEAGKGPELTDMSAVNEEKAYKLALIQVSTNQKLYATGELSGNYLATTDDLASAKDVYVEIVKDESDALLGYRLYFKGKNDAKSYISWKIAKNKNEVDTAYMDLVDKDAAVWSYDATTNSLKTSVTIGEKTEDYYFGTYQTYTTISLSKSSYISADNTGVSQFPAFLADIVFAQIPTREIEVEETNATVTGVPETAKDGQRITFTVAVADGYEGYSLVVSANGTAITPEKDGSYAVIVNGETKITAKMVSQQMEIISFAKATELAGTTKNEYTADKYYMMGTITEIASTQYGNMTIADSDGNTFTIYGTYDATGANRYDAMTNAPKVGDVIVVYGILGYYNAPQMKNGWIVETTSFAKATELAGTTKNEYTADKYYMMGTITEIASTQYGNMTIADSDGNTFTIYGTYDATGANRYDAMTNAPKVGDVIVVYGILGYYNAPQMKNGWIIGSFTPTTSDGGGGDGGTDAPVTDPSANDGSSIEKALTVEELYTKYADLAKNAVSSEKVYVKGIISSDPSYNEEHSSWTFYFKSDLANSKQVQGYSAKLSESIATICQNDEIVICGYVTNYNGLLEVAYASSHGVSPEVVSRTIGTSTISFVANDDVDIVLGATSGANGSEFTFTVTAKNETYINRVFVNGAPVTALDDGSYKGVVNGDTKVSVEALNSVTGEQTATVDLTGKFSTYAESWETTYTTHQLTSADLGVKNMSLDVDFTNAAKQTSTITGCPVVASKGSNQYVTISVASLHIKSATFNLAQWSTKKFAGLTIEYTTDGTTWTAVDGVGQSSTSNNYFEAELSTGDLPENVTAVRLVIYATGTKNVQVGISGFTIVAE